MAAPAINQTNFTTGELSPEAAGRADIAKYNNAAKLLKNCIVQALGGAKGRGGLRFIAETKDSTKRSRLVPFIFSREQAYMLEFGEGYMRVFKDGAEVADPITPTNPYEIVSPYSEAMVLAMDYVQGADTMFLAQQAKMPQRLRRFGHADWRLGDVPFVHLPFEEIGHRPATALTLSASTVGLGRTATAAVATFVAADVGRVLSSGGGVAVVVGVTSGTVATLEIQSGFSSTSLAAGSWVLEGSPQAPVTASATGPLGSMIELQSGAAGTAGTAITITNAWLSSYDYGVGIQMNVPGHGLSVGQTITTTGFSPSYYNANYVITHATTDYLWTNLVDRGVYAAQPTIIGNIAVASSSGVGGWRAVDKGSYVILNGGIVQIEDVPSSEKALGRVLRVLSSTLQTQIGAWSLNQPAWNSVDGYPRTVTLHAQRLAMSGSIGFPQTIWFSEIGNTLNMLRDTLDDSGFAYNLDSREVNPIAFLPTNKILMALTYGGEFTVTGGQEKPIGPNNPKVEQQSGFGCALVRPVMIGKQLFYVQRDGKVLRAATYQYETESFVSGDVSKLSNHLMAPGIVEMAYQQFPYSCIWMVRADGALNSVTIDAEENVIAWTWHDTDGFFESVACIPGPDGEDQVWVIVRRVINGVTKRYVELLDDTTFTDCCVTGTSGTATTTWGGFSHLEGKTVHVRGNGAYLGTAVVTAGQIELNSAVTSIEAGLDYTPTITMLTPEMQLQTGSAQGKQMRVVRAQALVLNTTNASINGDLVQTRRFDTPGTLDNPPPEFTGVIDLPTLGWEKGRAETTIARAVPGPFYVLSVIRRIEVNQ